MKNPYLTCVSCALYFSTCRLQYMLATELPAIVAIVSGRVVDRQGRMYNLAIHRFMCRRHRVADSLLTETANSEQLLIVAAVLHVSSSQAGRTALF